MAEPSLELRLAGLLKRTTPRPTLHDVTVAFHHAMVRLALARNEFDGEYNLSAVARELGIRRAFLYKILRGI